jgi:hypothetical protein
MQSIGYAMAADIFNIQLQGAQIVLKYTEPTTLPVRGGGEKKKKPHAKDFQNQGGVNLHMPILLKNWTHKHSKSKRGKKATTYLRSSDNKQPTGVDMKGCFFIQILLWYHRSNHFGHNICTEVLKADFLRMLNRNHNRVHT